MAQPAICWHFACFQMSTFCLLVSLLERYQCFPREDVCLIFVLGSVSRNTVPREVFPNTLVREQEVYWKILSLMIMSFNIPVFQFIAYTNKVNKLGNKTYHIRRYKACHISSLLSATGKWALGQPRKESQFPAFGNLHHWKCGPCLAKLQRWAVSLSKSCLMDFKGAQITFFKLVENLCISANDNVIFKLCFCALSGNQKTKRRPSISTDTITCKIMQSVKSCKVQNYATFGIAKVFYFALYYQFVLWMDFQSSCFCSFL